MARKASSKRRTEPGDLGYISPKKPQLSKIQKNHAMIDVLRVATTYGIVVTNDYQDELPLIEYSLSKVYNLFSDYDTFRAIANSHLPRESSSDDHDWMLHFRSQERCDYGRNFTPPRWGRDEIQPKLQAVIFESTLKSLAKSQNKATLAISFDPTAELLKRASKDKSNTVVGHICKALSGNLKSQLVEIPPYYMRVEISKTGKFHFHGGILCAIEDIEKVRDAFKQTSVKPVKGFHDVYLKPQPDILNFWSIKWGDYLTKTAGETDAIITHSVFRSEVLIPHARTHYNTIRSIQS